MTNIWCVRAESGTYASQFVSGGYVAIGWNRVPDLSQVLSRDELYAAYRQAYPEDKSPVVIGQQVGQIARFLLEIKAGDYVITPAPDTESLHYGTVLPDPSYFYAAGDDGCPYRHRRRVQWDPKRIRRSDLSVPFQNTIRSSLTVFAVSQSDEFLEVIDRRDLLPNHHEGPYDASRVVLEQVLNLTAEEFEILVNHLLTALGFEASKKGKRGDGGVDNTGVLNVGNLAKVEVFVQAKRYKLRAKVRADVVKQLRASIPSSGQGAFITTADFQEAAKDVAFEAGFPRIALINGHQLVDLLVEYWDDIPSEFRDRLELKRGLVRA